MAFGPGYAALGEPLAVHPQPWADQYDQAVRRRERLGFSIAGFGQNLVYNFVSLYLLVHLVEGSGSPEPAS